MLISCSFILVAALCRPSPAQDGPEYLATSTPDSAFIFPALQTHMPTRHGNVPPPPSMSQLPPPSAAPRTTSDPVQMQREAQELLELSQSLQADIESVNRGVLPKDTIDKLKRIQKLAKHLRGEIEP